jgi:hypothetical protein
VETQGVAERKKTGAKINHRVPEHGGRPKAFDIPTPKKKPKNTVVPTIQKKYLSERARL